jgi:cell division protein FtsB
MAQAVSASAKRAAARRRQRETSPRPAKGRTGIRWDRVARAALLATLGIVLLLYVSPLERWMTQRQAAGQGQSDLGQLQQQNKQLRTQIQSLHSPTTLELEARKLGMIRPGERAYVVENPPKN